MNRPEESSLCVNCGATDNETDARFCQTCGMKLGSHLTTVPAPPTPSEEGTTVADKYILQSLLWTAPTYNAYAASYEDVTFTVVEQSVGGSNPSDSDPVEDGKAIRRLVSGNLEDAAPAFERFGLFKPVEQIEEGDRLFTIFEQIQGQALAHFDQLDEKEVHAIGLQLCDLAARFHRNGWVYNGFEPYNIFVDPEGRVRLLGFDRARRENTAVTESPIYPSRGYTAPELFDEGGAHNARTDIYSIGALMQFLLAGESLGDGVWLYPVATVFPNFERVIARALATNPKDRFQSAEELRGAFLELNLPVILQAGHFTDVGLARELNEDSVLALNLTQYYESTQTQIGIYIVSDGMGGEAAGEVASRVTVRAVAEWITEKLISASLKSTKDERIASPTQTGGLRLSIADGNELATTEMLRSAVSHANSEVMAYAKSNPDESGLGATCTVAMVVGEILTIAHVGDSRCYLLSGDKLDQLTEDHSVVQKMINTGSLSRSQARVHPYRNVIYRSIGSDKKVEVDIIRHKLEKGDVLMLCSDGLNGMIGDDQIRDIMMVNPDPNLAAKELVVAANAAGGDDNISVIVVRLS